MAVESTGLVYRGEFIPGPEDQAMKSDQVWRDAPVRSERTIPTARRTPAFTWTRSSTTTAERSNGSPERVSRSPVGCAAIAATCFIVVGGCGPPAAPPNVLLVVVDTLRASSLGSYGAADGRASLHMDRFAESSTRYTRAIASSPWTLPTHASIFTGRRPSEHGARTHKVADGDFRLQPLTAEHPTLAEVLGEAGYRTAAFAANAGFLGPKWKLDRGFDDYTTVRVPAHRLNQDHVLPWLRTWSQEGGPDRRPFFLFINYMDTHRPLNTQPLAGFESDVANRRALPVRLAIQRPIMTMREPLPVEGIETLARMYALAIANVDRAIGHLLDQLIELGLYENTLIILTSDHGEFFGEHWLLGHSVHLYQEVLWVPLLVKRPGQTTGRVDDTVVSSVDLPQMILSGLSPELAKRHAAEFPWAPGNHPIISEIHATPNSISSDLPWSSRLKQERLALVRWPYKYIHSLTEEDELYDLDADPGEAANLLHSRQGVAEAMRAQIERYSESLARSAPDTSKAAELTQREIEGLRALGYVAD